MSQYDAFAKAFSATRNRPWPEFEYLLEHLKPGQNLLDVGCGNGRLRHYLPDGVAYAGLDASAELLKCAAENHPDATFVAGDFTSPWPFPDGHFDVVAAVASFHHILNKKGQRAFLAQASRVMKKDSILFITTWKLPQKHRWANWLRGRFRVWNVPFQGQKRLYRWVTDRALQRLLARAGFVVERAFLYKNRNYVAIARKP